MQVEQVDKVVGEQGVMDTSRIDPRAIASGAQCERRLDEVGAVRASVADGGWRGCGQTCRCWC